MPGQIINYGCGAISMILDDDSTLFLIVCIVIIDVIILVFTRVNWRMIANSPRLISIPIVLGLMAVLVFVPVDEELPLWLRNDYGDAGAHGCYDGSITHNHRCANGAHPNGLYFLVTLQLTVDTRAIRRGLKEPACKGVQCTKCLSFLYLRHTSLIKPEQLYVAA
jgi:hypothetical protein